MSLFSSCTDCVSITSFEVRNEIVIYPQSKGRREKMFFSAPFLLRAPVDFHAASLQEPCSKIQNRGSLLGGIEREREITMVWHVPIFRFARGIVLELGCKMVFMFLSIPI